MKPLALTPKMPFNCYIWGSGSFQVEWSRDVDPMLMVQVRLGTRLATIVQDPILEAVHAR